MLDPTSKKKLLARLSRVEGQVAALRRMLEGDDYCVDVLLQISAAQGALGKAGNILLESHIRECVHEAFTQGDEGAREEKIDELMEVFTRYGGRGAR
ncbi:MAG: metal-sensitive transcriptional regulator [Deltaproteobacteria bacterium]|nr:metal-sensitive transcriptional regulator [Deltaproteobacteria bacterium]